MKIELHDYGVQQLFCYNNAEGSTITMKEGDVYYDVDTDEGIAVESVWDDESVSAFMQGQNVLYKDIQFASNDLGQSLGVLTLEVKRYTINPNI